MNYRRIRERIVVEMLRATDGQLDAQASIAEIAQRLGLTEKQAADRAYELARDELIDGLGSGSASDGYKAWLTMTGKRYAEYLAEPWYAKLWIDHKHAIVTGAFSIISAIIGGIVGGLFVLMAS